MLFYRYHVFFCENSRENGKQSCAQGDASRLCAYAKQKIKQFDLHKKGQIRINRAGCLGRCSEGPVLVIYPEGAWYTYRSEQDIDEIIQRHLLNQEEVTPLRLSSTPHLPENE